MWPSSARRDSRTSGSATIMMEMPAQMTSKRTDGLEQLLFPRHQALIMQPGDSCTEENGRK